MIKAISYDGLFFIDHIEALAAAILNTLYNIFSSNFLL